MNVCGLREFCHFVHPPQQVLIRRKWGCWFGLGKSSHECSFSMSAVRGADRPTVKLERSRMTFHGIAAEDGIGDQPVGTRLKIQQPFIQNSNASSRTGAAEKLVRHPLVNILDPK
jgi:hypothetical protein